MVGERIPIIVDVIVISASNLSSYIHSIFNKQGQWPHQYTVSFVAALDSVIIRHSSFSQQVHVKLTSQHFT